MTINISFAPWMVPPVLTIIYFLVANWYSQPTKEDRENEYNPVYILGNAFKGMFALASAVIITLLTWVIYLAIY